MKILIWQHKNKIAPTGGPSGYLSNLLPEFNKSEIEFTFLPDLMDENSNKSQFKRLMRKNLKFVLDLITVRRLMNAHTNIDIDINQFDVIHFHNTLELYKAREILDGYDGKIILTSHSPKPFHMEVIDDDLKMSPKQKIMFKKQIEQLKAIDVFAFTNANYLIFPCEEAEEPYINNWKWYRNFREENRRKYKYIPTSAKPATYLVGRSELRKKYGIPDDAILISYVGRHNETKGYDKLLEIGSRILQRNDNVFFIIAGKEEPLKGLDDSRWIEVGWTKDPHSLVHASDIFVLPNKETYFDLVLLEVLSLGKPVLASNTGGNKYFKNYKPNGFEYFNSVDEAIQKLENQIKLSQEELIALGDLNKAIFDRDFKTSNFIEKYEAILREVISE